MAMLQSFLLLTWNSRTSAQLVFPVSEAATRVLNTLSGAQYVWAAAYCTLVDANTSYRNSVTFSKHQMFMDRLQASDFYGPFASIRFLWTVCMPLEGPPRTTRQTHVLQGALRGSQICCSS